MPSMDPFVTLAMMQLRLWLSPDFFGPSYFKRRIRHICTIEVDGERTLCLYGSIVWFAPQARKKVGPYFEWLDLRGKRITVVSPTLQA